MSIASVDSSVTVPLVPCLASHSVMALRYRLYSGPVDLSPLVIRQERRFVWGQARVSAYVLGASHAVTVRLPNGAMLTELLTCLPPQQDVPEKEQERHREWPIPRTPGSQWETEFAESGLLGTVRLFHAPLTPDIEPCSFHLAPHDTLQEPFPLPNGDTAWTRVAWRLEGENLFIETVHTYPEDEAAVRTVTCLVLRT